MAVLLGVVAWAAPGMAAGGAGPDGTSGTAPSAATSVVNAIVAAMWGAIAVVLIHVIVTIRRRQEEEEAEELIGQPRKAWWMPWLAAAIIFATVVVPVVLSRRGGNGREVEAVATPSASVAPRSSDLTNAREPTMPSVWTILAIGAGAAAAAFVLYRKSSTPIQREHPPLPEEIVHAVDDSIHDIESEPDARRAIIRAYARMEGALARSGVPRRPSETPFEYIEGALRRLMVPAEPVHSLTQLFEIARFSDRHLDATMKQRAIDDLLEVRFALAAEVA